MRAAFATLFSVERPITTLSIAFAVAAVLLVGVSGLVTLSNAESFKQFSLDLQRDQIDAPLTTTVVDLWSAYEEVITEFASDESSSRELLDVSTQIREAVENGDSGLVDLLSFEGSILLLETLEKVRLKNIDDKYTLRGTSLVFTEDLGFTVSEWGNDQILNPPIEVISNLYNRDLGSEYDPMTFVWLENEFPYMTVGVPVGSPIQSYLLVHVEGLPALGNVDRRLGAEVTFLSKTEDVLLRLQDIDFGNSAERDISTFDLEVPNSFSVILDDGSGESKLGLIKVSTDTSELNESLAKASRNSILISMVAVLVVAAIALSLVIIIVKRLFDLRFEAERDLLSSINAAARIQTALLPTLEFRDVTIQAKWLPLDVVGGDIYVVQEELNRTIVAVIDCTGHGVQGSFLSVLAHTAFHSTIADHKQANAGQLLQEMQLRMITTLVKAGETQAQEGFDGSVCVFYGDSNNFEFAGINASILVVNKQGKSNFIEGTKILNKIPDNIKTETQLIEFKDNQILMFSDGLTDIPGGEKGRLFGKRRLLGWVEEYKQNSSEDFINGLEQTVLDYGKGWARRDDLTFLLVAQK